jgi:hypothetical protein
MNGRGSSMKGNGGKSKTKKINKEEEPIKTSFFRHLSASINHNTNIPSSMTYLFDLLEAVCFLWFIVHPDLNIFPQGSLLLS